MKILNAPELKEDANSAEHYNFKRDWPLVAGIGALALVFLIFTVLSAIVPPTDDVVLYFRYGSQVLDGKIPYRDFFIEYPPFSLPFFILPALFNSIFLPSSASNYTLLFQAQSFLLASGTLALVWAMLRNLYPRLELGRPMFFITLGTLLMSLYVLRRFDIGATFLLTLSLYLLYNRRPVWGGVVLGLATAAKLYPAVVLPLALIYFWRHKSDRKSAFQVAAGFCAGGGVVTLPFLIASLPGMLSFLRYHSERGIEIESLFASLMKLSSFLGGGPLYTTSDHGALNLVGDWSPFLANLSSVMTVAGLLVFYGYFWWASSSGRGQNEPDRLVQAAALAILWFILSNKVLSPYYPIWLLPFSAFWKGKKVTIYLAALALSSIPIPLALLGMPDPDWQPGLVIQVRNVLLVVLLIMQVRDVSAGAWPGKKGKA